MKRFNRHFLAPGMMLAALLFFTVPADANPTPDAATNAPQWIERPSPEYPAAAWRAGVNSGRAALRCLLSPVGSLSACQVTAETPPGLGFAEAALQAAGRARMTASRHPNQWVTFNVRFAVPMRTAALPGERYTGEEQPGDRLITVNCELLETGRMSSCIVMRQRPSDSVLANVVLMQMSEEAVELPDDWRPGLRVTVDRWFAPADALVQTPRRE